MVQTKGRHVNRFGHPRAGFTLTEILMAVGILTVGLTMVATVFPVAVDQNRRSYDLTQASLCARNAAAIMRIQRTDVLNAIPTNQDSGSAQKVLLLDPPPANISFAYDPRSFLYTLHPPNATHPTQYDRSYDGMNSWDAGHFLARIYLSRTTAPAPLPTNASKPYWTVWGPYRVAIVVFRARGINPGTDVAATDPNKALVAGDYVVDMTPAASSGNIAGRGEAYLVDHIGDGTSAATKIVVAPGPKLTAVSSTVLDTTASGVSQPNAQHGAVIAFHTFFGY